MRSNVTKVGADLQRIDGGCAARAQRRASRVEKLCTLGAATFEGAQPSTRVSTAVAASKFSPVIVLTASTRCFGGRASQGNRNRRISAGDSVAPRDTGVLMGHEALSAVFVSGRRHPRSGSRPPWITIRPPSATRGSFRSSRPDRRLRRGSGRPSGVFDGSRSSSPGNTRGSTQTVSTS
jgi:hypothetical protein